MLKIFILNILYLSIFVSSCPNGTLEWPMNQNGSCYFFETNMTPFSAAEVYCTKIGGHLVSVHDAFLNSILAGMF